MRAPARGNPRLVLGSASPRRADLLRQVGLEFEQVVSPEAEPRHEGDAPAEHVLASAAFKARSVAALLRRRGGAQAIVIGADTIVCLGDQVLGKPAGEVDARRMLRALAGHTHRVYTGVVLVCPDGRELAACEETRVTMGRLEEAEIAAYVASGEPLDKAGAYAVQGRGARFVERLEGCYYNVVGLPLARTCALLGQAGYDFSVLPPLERTELNG